MIKTRPVKNSSAARFMRFVAIWATFLAVGDQIFGFGDFAIWQLFGLLFKMSQNPV